MTPRTILLLVLLLPTPLSAWSKENQVQIGWEAARLAPPDLYRQILRHKLAFRDGLIAPFDDSDERRHEKNADGSGSLDLVIGQEAQRAVSYIVGHRPFEDVVEQLGVLVHYLNDANYPLRTSTADPAESKYADDFVRYVSSAEPRFAVAFYGVDERLDGIETVPAFVQRTLQRSRALYPFIGQEYSRIGGRSGVGAFDDRSTAFGVAAVSFSRALTDAVAVLRLVWLEAGGADPVPRLPQSADRLIKVPRLH